MRPTLEYASVGCSIYVKKKTDNRKMLKLKERQRNGGSFEKLLQCWKEERELA